MKKMKQKINLTEGSIIKALILLSLPIVFANLLQTAYQLTDTFWVGRLGADAIASVSLSFPIIFLMISIGGGLAIAGTILVAQYKGAGSTKQVNHVSAQTLVSMTVISIIVSVIGYYISEPMLRLMGASATVLPDATKYLQISFVGLTFLFGSFVFQSLMRGVGDATTPLYITLVTVLLNLVVDPLFIMGWGPIPAMGVAGAALATISTQGLGAIIGLVILFSGKYGIHLSRQDLIPDIPLIKKTALLGLPASVEHSLLAFGLTVLTLLAASFGTEGVAAYGIGSRVISFIIIPAIGFSIATSTLVGQNIGAGKIDRAEKTTDLGIAISFTLLTAIGVILFFAAKLLAIAFAPGEETVIALSTEFIKIMALAFGFMGVQQIIAGTFRGSGNTFMAMVVMIINLWIFNFPIAYILSKHTPLGISGIWWSFPASMVLSAIISWLWYKRGTWKNKKITENEQLEEKVIEETMIDEGNR